MSGLYSLNKDELVKIICTINYAELEKQVTELKIRYNYLIEQLENHDADYSTCDICKFTEILDNNNFYKIVTCNNCNKSFHVKCKPICCFCNLCSTCNPIKYAYDSLNGYYICENHNINN